jgi:hypothetical protein
MSLSILAVCLWVAAANVIAMFPSRDHHWRAAYALIVVGIPILGWVTYANGPFWGLLALVAGASILRWPLIYTWRWLRGAGAKKIEEPAE